MKEQHRDKALTHFFINRGEMVQNVNGNRGHQNNDGTKNNPVKIGLATESEHYWCEFMNYELAASGWYDLTFHHTGRHLVGKDDDRPWDITACWADGTKQQLEVKCRHSQNYSWSIYQSEMKNMAPVVLLTTFHGYEAENAALEGFISPKRIATYDLKWVVDGKAYQVEQPGCQDFGVLYKYLKENK